MTRVAHIKPFDTGGKPPEAGHILHFQLLQRSVFGVQCSVFSHIHHSDPEPNWYIYHSDHLGSSAFLTDASGDPTQHLQYMPFGETFVEQRSVTSYYTPYTFSAKERDLETGYSYFGARYYDADISIWLSVDPMADKYPSVSSYMYVLGNPIIYFDPDGRWVPDVDANNNVVIKMENGDNRRSLRKFMGDGYSRKQIKQLWRSRDVISGQINLTQELGGVFQEMTTAMNEAKARNNPTNSDYDKGTLSRKNRSSNYNCWGACIALNEGKKLQGNGAGTGIGIIDPNEFDAKLKTDYTPGSINDATVGSTVLRFADRNNNSTHGAIYMGTDRNGNHYVFSKNGWVVRPEIHKVNYFLHAVGVDYGTIRGINPGESGSYNFKR
jgi:RHS repeat-associated protein